MDLPSAFELIDLQFPQSLSRYDGESAAAFLDRLRFPTQRPAPGPGSICALIFANPHDFAARELVTMFHTYFTGSAEGLLFDVPVDDFNTSLWDPLGDYLRDAGVTIHLDSPVDALHQTEQGWRVGTSTGGGVYDAVVLAADPRTSRGLIAALHGETQQLADLQSRVARRTNAPAFAVIRLWMSDTVHSGRPAFLGTSGYQLLDNISVLERFEATAAAWTQTHGGSVVELHAYAVDAPAAPNSPQGQTIRTALLDDMRTVFPETQNMEIIAEQYLLEDDCSLADVSLANHPAVTTGTTAWCLPATGSAPHCRLRSWNAPQPPVSWRPMNYWPAGTSPATTCSPAASRSAAPQQYWAGRSATSHWPKVPDDHTNRLPRPPAPAPSARKATIPGDEPAGRVTKRGIMWRIGSLTAAKDVLLARRETIQAGFTAEYIPRTIFRNHPILISDGPQHDEQRRNVARFFAPTVVAARYSHLMTAVVNNIIAQTKRTGTITLDEVALYYTVEVTASIGLTTPKSPHWPAG